MPSRRFRRHSSWNYCGTSVEAGGAHTVISYIAEVQIAVGVQVKRSWQIELRRCRHHKVTIKSTIKTSSNDSFNSSIGG